MEKKYKKKRYKLYEILSRVYGEEIAKAVIKDVYMTNTFYTLAYLRNELLPEEIKAE